MAQIWFRGNKAAQKWTEEQALDILAETYQWLKDNEDILLKEEVELHLMEEHSLGTDTYRNWVNKQYIDNKSIQQLSSAIDLILAKRVVYDKLKQLRSNVQSLVLQSKFAYREKKEVEQSHTFNRLPSIKVDGEELNIDIGD
jgi:hypothetical protein